ncbi:ABC transporter permease [Albimonas sp. CAU 1670]|uniref:ABC transporter permease n=1 Tax=Albimonas sp. CAU 1670 TaxID=3032599 RepID=UPI0023DAE11D|nr:FtsX-like permease family protein [Albimonas sp. CAU 1670]MDF2234948.1 ABC transporter permease [Albimonas sp. CAU 1670]
MSGRAAASPRRSSLRPAFAIARRELRGGLKGFGVFLACLALGVAAIAAVGSVRSAISEGLSREGQAILGGDAEIEFTYRFATPEERAWMQERAEAVSETVEFRSMVAAPGPDGQLDRALTQVKGVDDLYPLYGEARLSGGLTLDEALEARDGTWGVVMAQALVDRLGLAPGDRVRLGAAEYELRAVLEREPDEAAAGMAFGPRTLMHLAALEPSGLIAPGTLYDTDYRLRLAPDVDLEAMSSAMTAAFPEAGLRWRDRRNGAPGVQNFVERIGAFLVLVGLAALAMGGVGVSAAVRSYMERKTDTIATLKTLGAEGRTIFAIYLAQVGALAALGVGIGLAVGAAIPALAGPLLEDRLPVPALFDVYARPLWEAGTYGLLAALIFALWPLARARDVRAAALYREAGEGARSFPRPVYLGVIAALTALLVAAAVAFSGIWQIALGFAGGVAGALLVLWLAALGVRALAQRLSRGRALRGRPAARLALGAVGGSTGETSGVVLSLGLGLAVLAAVGQIDWNLRHVIDADLPAKAPAYFFVDVQNDQLPGFLERAEAYPGVEQIETAPMLRGVITRLDDVPARDATVPEEYQWVLRGDRGVTYAAAPPPGTEITEGEWWPEDYDGETLVSFSEEHGKGLGLKLGDTVTVSVLGREITARIANFRVVNFRDMGINFLMVMSPGVLAGAPHTHIATVYAEPAAEGGLLRELAGAYPNITAIRVRDAIDRVSEALRELASATRWGASVTLVTGIVVLIGAAAAGERRRVYEAAVLKTVGAARGLILRSFALRSALLGAAAGIVALAAGVAAGWAVMVFVMDAPYRFEPVSALVIVAGGAAASLLAGLAFAVRPLAARPAQVLRARE